MATPREKITEILRRIDPSTPQLEELFAVVYDELRLMAEGQLRRERPDHTLQATALVHEAFLKLADTETLDLESRAHFFGVAARAMRQVLVDYARRRQAAKRGGELERVTLNTEVVGGEDAPADVLDLHAALEKLAAEDKTLARLVEFRFFAGLTLDEAADMLGVSRRKAAKDWSVARLWLRRELDGSA
jgi:RNA polymerase sigma factor (TIGR02999 family)